MNPASNQQRGVLTLTQWSFLLILVFPMASVLVHIAQPSFNPIDVAVSYYMNGRLGGFLSAGLAALGAGSLLLAAATYESFGDRAPRRGLVLLGFWSVGCVVGGIFPPDAFGQWNRPPSLSGMLHSVAAIIAFGAFPFAAIALAKLYVSATGPHRPLAAHVATLCAVLTLLLFVCLVPAFRHRPPWALGLVERVTLGCYVWWLLLANRAVRNIGLTLHR